jgi:hypothetical protein
LGTWVGLVLVRGETSREAAGWEWDAVPTDLRYTRALYRLWSPWPRGGEAGTRNLRRCHSQRPSSVRVIDDVQVAMWPAPAVIEGEIHGTISLSTLLKRVQNW